MNLVLWALDNRSSPRVSRIVTKLEKYMRLARDLSTLSTCYRLSVGCVILKDDLTAIPAIGYNGQPSGSPNSGCSGGVGDCGCIHAEANALVKVPGWYNDMTVVLTCSPCPYCAGLVVNSSRISVVVYDQDYRRLDGLDVLRMAGVVSMKWDEVRKALGATDEGVV